MVKVPLSVFVIRTSKKASLLSCSSSLVNLMFLVVLLIVSRMSSVLSFLTVASTSSTYLSHVLMSSLFVTALLSRSCITASARKLESGEGLNYNTTDAKKLDFIADLESALKNTELTEETKNNIRHQVTTNLLHLNHPIDLTKQEREALVPWKTLRKTTIL